MVEYIGVSDTLHMYFYACSHGPADDLKRAATHDPATHGAATHGAATHGAELLVDQCCGVCVCVREREREQGRGGRGAFLLCFGKYVQGS